MVNVNVILTAMLFWAQLVLVYYVHDRFEKQYVLIQAMNIPCKGIE